MSPRNIQKSPHANITFNVETHTVHEHASKYHTAIANLLTRRAPRPTSKNPSIFAGNSLYLCSECLWYWNIGLHGSEAPRFCGNIEDTSMDSLYQMWIVINDSVSYSCRSDVGPAHRDQLLHERELWFLGTKTRDDHKSKFNTMSSRRVCVCVGVWCVCMLVCVSVCT